MPLWQLGHFQTKSNAVRKNWIWTYLILDFSNTIIRGNKFLLLKLPNIYWFVIEGNPRYSLKFTLVSLTWYGRDLKCPLWAIGQRHGWHSVVLLGARRTFNNRRLMEGNYIIGYELKGDIGLRVPALSDVLWWSCGW